MMMNDNELQVSNDDHDDSDNTMAVLSSLGGGDQEPEGQPLGLDPDAGRSKLSGSTLAVGAVVLVGVGALFAMKMTLKAEAVDATTAEAELAINVFMDQLAAAEATGVQGPIEQIGGESMQIINELKADPTAHQVPSEEVEKNPFELMGIVRAPVIEDENTGPSQEELEARELEGLQAVARGFHVDSISGRGPRAVVFIDGAMYRIGDTIAGSGFTVAEVDGLDVVVRVPATASKPWAFRLHYE
ncbi:hypothetical protein OT109_18340 [Phycisphaeraceae bacterium D3-23]